MDQIAITALLVGIAVACLSHWLWQRRDIYKFAYQLPHTMWGLPFLGCILSIRRIDAVLSFLQNHWKTCKKRTFCTFLTVTPIVFTSDPEVIRQILTQSAFIQKSRNFYNPVKESLGGGMLGLRAEKSLRHRKMLAPAFRPKQLLSFMDTFNSKGSEFVRLLNQMYEANGETRNLLNELRICAIDISRITTMGCTSQTFDYQDDLSKIHKRLVFAFYHVFYEIVLGCANLRWLIQYNPFYTYTKKKLYSIADKIISYRVNTIHASNDNELKPEKYLVIDQGYKHYLNGDMQWHEVVGEMNGVLVASYETTSSTLYGTMLLLAMHPDIQERLYDEIVSIFPSKDMNVESEHLGQLNYLEMVINEALRLFPSAPLIAREVNQETPLEIDSKWHKLPKDMQIVIDILALHRNPNIWGPNAEKFDPDNFLPQNVANRNPYAFIPFSKGARICFGWAYAYMVLKVMLVHVLRNYKLSTKLKYEDIRLELNLFLVYKTEPMLQLHRRS